MRVRIRSDGYQMVEGRYGHIVVAEGVLGKPLPKGAEVHHIDGNPSNNDLTNLVICPDHRYHFLLHQREKAYDACGNANHLKCRFCKKYDDPINLVLSKRACIGHHRACEAKYRRDKRAKKKVNAFSVSSKSPQCF